MLTCIERRCSILVLDAPKRSVIRWDDLTDEQIDRLAAGEPPEKGAERMSAATPLQIQAGSAQRRKRERRVIAQSTTNAPPAPQWARENAQIVPGTRAHCV